jgi:hypothetical protein
MAAIITSIEQTLTRRGLIGRLTGAVLTASMAGVLTAKRAHADCPPPGFPDCHGLDGCWCHGGGCTPQPSGGCCWVYVDNQACQVFQCCDQTCADGVLGICRYLICNCC